MKKKIVIFSISIFFLILGNFCYAQIKGNGLNNFQLNLINQNYTLLETPTILGQKINSQDGSLYSADIDYYLARSTTTASGIFDDTISAFTFFDNDSSQYIVVRSPLEFDLSGIDTSKIVSATINLFPLGENVYGSSTEISAFFKGEQETPFILDDFKNFDVDNKYTDSIDFTTLQSNQYNSFSLNNNGINYLKSGGNKFMFVNEDYDIASNTPPTFSDLGNTFVAFAGTNWYNEEIRPYLDIVLESGTTTPIIASGDDIGIIYYNSTTTKIDENTTVTSGTYKIPYLLFKFVSIVMAFCLAVLITFFLSFINKKKKL